MVPLIDSLIYEMLKIRLFEERVASRYAEQAMRCPVHLCIGQEAIAVGVSSQLSQQDLVYSNHRAHGHYLAKGGDMTALIAEFYGLENGCVGGRGGSMHLMDLEAGFAGSTPIVGGTVPIATGAAWSTQLQRKAAITVSYFGDGCFEEGVVHESLNFAALHQLPILYVCENNQYSVYTPLEKRQSTRSDIAQTAQSMGLTTFKGAGNDVEKVQALTQKAIKLISSGQGPVLLELATYRWPEHCGPNDDNHLGYRPEGELAHWQANCPIQKMLKKHSISSEQVKQWQTDLNQQIDQAWEKALAGKPPKTKTLGDFVYAC